MVQIMGEFIKKYGRLGRSFGCPSISMEIYKEVIDAIRDGSLLFIYSPDSHYLKSSQVLNPVSVENDLSAKNI